jgi:hypothetical protein
MKYKIVGFIAMIKTVKGMREPRDRSSALRWLARVVLLLAVLAMAPFFAAGTGQATPALSFQTGIAVASAEVSSAPGAEATIPSVRGLGCGEQAGDQNASGHSGTCAQHCGAGCSFTLGEAREPFPVLPMGAQNPLRHAGVIGSVDSEPAFRPPRFVR